MKKANSIFHISATILVLLLSTKTHSQNFCAVVKDKLTNEVLIGATMIVQGVPGGSTTDINGKVCLNVGLIDEVIVEFRYIGYETYIDTIGTLTEDTSLILLSRGEELEAIVITATRSSRTIEKIPTRTEVITAEELGEKAIMNSTNIAMILRESTGIQVQQTSANSGNQSLRIQGLDGRYTQLLRDGFPLFSGFSGGLSVMQIPPLDLKQVEVIKGSASTLFGGGAIAGLVNLVSKTPIEDEPEHSLMLNQTSALGTTLNAYSSNRSDKFGYSIYVSGNNQVPYDPNDDDFTDIPQVKSISINPKLFYYADEKSTLWLGLNATLEDRLGGDIQVINDKRDSTHTFSEQNLSNRYSSQVSFERKISNEKKLVVKNSFNYFNRNIEIPGFQFQGTQLGSFSEIAYGISKKKTDWIFGANLFTDNFKEMNIADSLKRDYNYTTFGGFIQSTLSLNKRLSIESGLRTDYNGEFGPQILPKVSVLITASEKLSGRIGGGFGYKLPTIFTEDAERLTFQGISPLSQSSIALEKSIGFNFDINYRTTIADKVVFSINQLFFFTQLENPLILEENQLNNTYSFTNSKNPVYSKGFETNIKCSLEDFKLFLQYALIDVKLNENQKPLTPKHNAGAILMFEQEEKWRIGYEVYYTGSQLLSSNYKTRDFWMMGFMIMRQFEKIDLFINFENFTDARQSRYQDMVLPPHEDPTFTEIWAPTDGFVANAGIKINL